MEDETDVTKPTEDQIAKLPKWARAYIMELDYERRTAVEAYDNQTESEVWFEPDGAHKVYVPSNRICVKIPSKRRSHLEIYSRAMTGRPGKGVTIYGSTALVIRPEVSNVVSIDTVEDE